MVDLTDILCVDKMQILIFLLIICSACIAFKSIRLVNTHCVLGKHQFGTFTPIKMDRLCMAKRKPQQERNDVEELITGFPSPIRNLTLPVEDGDKDTLTFPELEASGIDEKALRKTPFGKLLFSVLDNVFPIFKEPNWFDVYGKLHRSF